MFPYRSDYIIIHYWMQSTRVTFIACIAQVLVVEPFTYFYMLL